MDTVHWRLFADLAEVAGGREHTVSIESGATVEDALAALLNGREDLSQRILDGDDLADDVNLMRNGTPVSESDDVEEGDELAMFPPVTGGSRTRAGW
ncbi:MAG: ubiquitin-like small modifier protein 1 [Halobellus sp.]|uniref:ubiquitin-like small modifier protein 1 n=1 Tax=Halobellus sp. TaxID=1979212 RepID=UPI0035D48703